MAATWRTGRHRPPYVRARAGDSWFPAPTWAPFGNTHFAA